MSTGLALARRRMAAQRLTGPPLDTPEAVVGWFGAVQAQEYPYAKWCLSQRTPVVTDADVERALAEGTILRTHALRPTWHFLSAQDIRWVLELSASRVHAANRLYYRRFGLDDATLARGRAVLVSELEGGRHKTRTELADALHAAGIDKQGPALAYLIMHAELEALICSGPPRGTKQTYALLDERVPDGPLLERDEAVTELVTRFFTSHGPATVKDFVWWSGLTGADARLGFERADGRLRSEEVDGRTYWSAAEPVPAATDPEPSAQLLQAYDEYVVAYTQSRDLCDLDGLVSRRQTDPLPFMHPIVVDTQVVGRWRRTLKPSSGVVEATLYRRLGKGAMQALRDEVERHARFLERPVSLTVVR